jgi:hypothetical protein
VFRFEGVEGNVLLNQERRTCDGPAPGSDNSLLEVEIGGGGEMARMRMRMSEEVGVAAM